MVGNSRGDEDYTYDESAMAAAWRLFINTGEIDERVVRPIVARSWMRCREAGVNPWSSYFPSNNEKLLKEKRKQYAHSIEADEPVMQMLMALLKCNVSLMDQENFVFSFMTPLPRYPRTMGTFQHENILGTGNSTVVAYEKKPVRIEGFEGYRSVSQGYSGVSAPFLDVNGEYFGALNLNDPFGSLPKQAMAMCELGVALCNELFVMRREMWSCLRSAEFFQPLLDLMTDPVVVVDPRGNVLLVNDAMKPYVPDFDEYSYGMQSLDAYLDRKTPLKTVLLSPIDPARDMQISFRLPRSRTVKELLLVNRTELRLRNGLHFSVLVFKTPQTQAAEAQEREGNGRARRVSNKRFTEEHADVDYIGETPEWKAVDTIVSRIAPINANALILGETGTGKELVARAIHRRSGRKGAFVALNCGAIPRDLFAAELFGYEAGAFTGAKEGGSIGKIEAANGGTVFLDEIGEMPLDLQVGLLRVIQENSVVRLGSAEERPLDVRFVAATNQDLTAMIDTKDFRADLYYRLSSIEIDLPPLRNRIDDIPRLVEHFNRRLSESLYLDYSPFPREIEEAFKLYTWPGNVRELRNAVERCLILAGTGSEVSMGHLPIHIVNSSSKSKSFVPASFARVPDEALASLTPAELEERSRISRLLLECDGNLSKVASELGISRTTLYKRLKHYHLRVRTVVETEGDSHA